MSVLKLQITTGRPNAELVTRYESGKGPKAIINDLCTFLEGVGSGSELAQDSSNPPSVNIKIQGNEVQASGTFTLASVVATDTCVVNGVTFTAIASGATGNQFNVGVSDAATAVNLAAAINASVTALIPGYVTASAALTVVTVTSVAYGLNGNQITLTGSTDIVASGARLTGGAADPTAVTLSF